MVRAVNELDLWELEGLSLFSLRLLTLQVGCYDNDSKCIECWNVDILR